MRGYDLVDEVLRNHKQPFSEQQLVRIQQAVERDSLVEYFDLGGERAMTLDVLQRAFTDDGNGDGRITAEGLELMQNVSVIYQSQQAKLEIQGRLQKTWESVSAPLALMTMPTRKQMVATYESFLTKAEIALGMAYYEHPEFDFEIQDGDSGNPLLDLFLPAVYQLRQAIVLRTGNQSGTVAAIAVYRYQQKHGKLPTSLNQLVGEFLDEIPIDQCNGQPLHYRTTSDGFAIYSIGLDGVDDGGDAIMAPKEKSSSTENESNSCPQKAAHFSFKEKNLKGDWVLWPRFSQEED